MSENVNEENLPVIYTKKPCVKCDMTKKKMDQLGVKYRVVEATAEDREKFKAMGHKNFPIVIVNEQEQWSDFRVDRIAKLAAQN